MKKNYILLSALVLTASISFAQNRVVNGFEEATPELNTEDFIPKANRGQQKAFLDTLFYEDFNGGAPAGWVIANNSGNSNNWIWGNGMPGGQFSTNADTLASPTGANGYMILPADLYNTPIPGPGPTPMDASFTSTMISPPTGSIQFPAGVLIRFHHSQRYCCSGANELVLEVSTDNITWTTYDATGDRNPNTATPNGEELEINVSGALGNATSAYIRFRSTGNSHYYWMVDDITMLEGPSNSMIIDDRYVAYGDTAFLTYNPPFYQYPQAIMRPIDFGAFTSNYGTNTQNGVTINYEVLHDSTYNGGAGTGLGYLTQHSVTSATPIMPDSQYNEAVTPGFISTIDGFFRTNIWVTSDSVNQNTGAPMPPSLVSYDFVISDSIMDKTSGPYVGDAGPGNYQGGGNDGDRWASMHTMGDTSALATSISLLVANVTSNDGAQIQPRVWEWRDTGQTYATAIVEPPLGSSPFTVTIDTTMLGRWLTLPLFPPATLNANTQYLVGWEQMGGANVNAEFTVARDRTREPAQPPVTNFVYINDANPGWGWVTQLGGIRLNFQTTIGVEEQNNEKVDFAVMPNPTTGELKVVLESNVAKTYRMSVRNMLGQTVYNDNVSVNGKRTIDMDLSGNDKGVYFVTLENGNERLVKKVVLK